MNMVLELVKAVVMIMMMMEHHPVKQIVNLWNSWLCQDVISR